MVTSGTGGWSTGNGISQNYSNLAIDASLSSPVYGNSDTVQSRAWTLLPCLNAFDAATNSGLIDVAELAQEMAGKLDKTVPNTVVKYVTDTFDDGTNGYRKWSDGWIEQGSAHFPVRDNQTVQLWLPFSSADDSVVVMVAVNAGATGGDGDPKIRERNTGYIVVTRGRAAGTNNCIWYTCGQGA